MAKIVKRRGYQLEVRVRKTVPREVRGPCDPSWKSPNALRITFFTRTRNQYLDSSSSTLVRVEEDTTGVRNMCVDNRLFFKHHQQLNHYIAISQLLESLQVKADLHDRITSQIMSMGESKYRGGKKVKRKILKGLRVDLTRIQTFLLDRDSVNQLVDEALADGRIWRGTTK